ncbi:hypothetical protein [Flavobacterium capsici]|uniref:Lipoprotein n=1 Tax=Flavobacterium capsici TaxID=3075618 RepID=A0AA96F071_9FLAO|nr:MULTISPECIES: hypothetical protein [unclassified Flavobacterium]WNM19963.1 hypothetical protein RN608_04595 [Flavobacterium sp. PMR2A8]WNM21352.1 hypothetical protein RN605_11765 [Flavobacterium sp. PMTSA4]
MKKIIFVLMILFVFIFSCKTKENFLKNIEKNELNYIPYYLTVEKVKKLYQKKEYKKSFVLLDSLFNEYEPLNTITFDELELYCELSIRNNSTKKLNKFIPILVSDYGYDLGNYQDSLWVQIKKKTKYKNVDLKIKYTKFLNGINLKLRDSIIKIFEEDQKIRKTRNTVKIDSVDKINELKVLKIIKEVGYPSMKLIGGHGKDEKLSPIVFSVLLKHMSYDNILQIEPILLNEVKKGKCPPFVYAEMLDARKVMAKENTRFEYFGTYKNIKPTDTAKTNKARLDIGLPTINY